MGQWIDYKALIERYVPDTEEETIDQEVILYCINTFDDVLARENKIAHVTASAWVVNQDRTKVLMVYHNLRDCWAWCGGHADGDADLLHVALKEVHEEAGLKLITPISKDIYSVEVLTVAGHRKKGNYVSPHLHLNVTFLLEAKEQEGLRIKPDENSCVSWILIENVLGLVKTEEDRKLYQKLNEKLKHIIAVDTEEYHKNARF